MLLCSHGEALLSACWRPAFLERQYDRPSLNFGWGIPRYRQRDPFLGQILLVEGSLAEVLGYRRGNRTWF